MKWSRRELSIDMVIHLGIFKNSQITLFPVSPIHMCSTGTYVNEVLTNCEPVSVY